jgi:hypothetical protein
MTTVAELLGKDLLLASNPHLSPTSRNKMPARCWHLTPVIPATQGAEIKNNAIQSQSEEQIVLQTLSQKNPSQKRSSGVASGVGPGFKPQSCKKRKRKEGSKSQPVKYKSKASSKAVNVLPVIKP